MQAVIFAAGRGTRMGTLTEGTPKPMINLCGSPILLRVIEALPISITDVHVVVGYLEDSIRDATCFAREGLTVHFHSQSHLNGTFDALSRTKDALGTMPFLVLNGDDLYRQADLEKLITAKPFAMLAKTVERPNRCSHLKSSKGHLLEILPKTLLPDETVLPATLTYTGACLLDARIFELEPATIPNGELSLPHTLEKHLHQNPVIIIDATFWMPVGSPEELQRAEQHLMRIDEDISSC